MWQDMVKTSTNARTDVGRTVQKRLQAKRQHKVFFGIRQDVQRSQNAASKEEKRGAASVHKVLGNFRRTCKRVALLH